MVQVDPNGDADGDGKTNYQEYLAGTDPKDPNSSLQSTSIAPTGAGALPISWRSVAGQTYTVERSINMQCFPSAAVNVEDSGIRTGFVRHVERERYGVLRINGDVPGHECESRGRLRQDFLPLGFLGCGGRSCWGLVHSRNARRSSGKARRRGRKQGGGFHRARSGAEWCRG